MKLNNFQLKVIAAIAMTLSHIQYHIGINNILYIGQLAFPIFAYLSAYGMKKTSNQTKYISRVLIYGVILQIPIFIMGFTYINIFVTIGLGLLAIHFIELKQYYLLFPILLFAYLTNLDYGIFGILLIVIPYLCKYNVYIFSISLIILQIIWINILNQFTIYQWFSILAIPLLLMYNYELGYSKYKWWFYIYYPLHIVIIYLFI